MHHFMVHDPELVLCFRKRKKKGVQKTRICFLNVLLNTRKAQFDRLTDRMGIVLCEG